MGELVIDNRLQTLSRQAAAWLLPALAVAEAIAALLLR